MTDDDLVLKNFDLLGRELGVEITPVRGPEIMGERQIKVRFGSAYCIADWWDRGLLFTLFLGRHYTIAGRRFVSEFEVDAYEESPLRRVADHNDMEGQIKQQFGLLRKHGLPWLRGDFSREPFIRHRVRPAIVDD